ncbi:hypothetical protein BBJ28_00018702 [Nothophytophthora sp. Chile5]|nr:hypothetical protein BBJ28_00018702 [Nothophytophthora sp. Chile5]
MPAALLLEEPTAKRRAERGDEDASASASARDCKRLKAGDANMVKWEPERWEQAEAENDDDDVPLARYQRRRPRPPSKAKEQAKKRMRKPQEQETTFELSAKRRVLVRKWKNVVLVDIREFYDEDGVAKPSKKGLSLSLEQWHKLVELSDAVSEAIQLVEENRIRKDSLVDVPGRIPKPGGDSRAIAFPLSAKRRMTVRFFHALVLIDLREFYEQDGAAKPGKKGIALSKDQWVSLQEVAEDISDAAERL